MTAVPKRPRSRRPSSRRVPKESEPSDYWQEGTMARLRSLIMSADPEMIEEQKWKKPSNPEGVPVWSHDGIVCVGNELKNSVRLTFPHGIEMRDPGKLFNSRLDSTAVRAIDVHQDESLNGAALRALIREGVRVNAGIVRERAARSKAAKR